MSNNINNPKTRNRYFGSGLSLMYNGNKYPAAETSILNEDGTTTKRNIGVDANNNYFYVENGQPHIVESLFPMDEVTVTGKHNPMNYLTMSNDVTQVNNLPHKINNLHLQQRALEGAKGHAQWEKEHPNISAWSNAAAAVPFAVAAAPLVLGGGEAVAGTALGQGITNGLGIVANVASNNTWLPWVDAGLTSYFGAKGLQDIANGKFTPETALEVAPLTQMAKPMYEAGKGTYDVGKELYDTGALWDKYTTFQGRFGNYGDNLLTNIYGTYARRLGLPDKARIPADVIRKIGGDVSIDSNGMVNFTGHKGFAGNAHINTTLDRPVVSHIKGNWDGKDTYLFPTRDFIDQTNNGALKSIEPSDAFANGAEVSISPNRVTVISGDVNTLKRAKEAGMQTLSSPRLRRMYNNEKYKGYQSNENSRFNITKTPEDALLPYATEMQRLQSMRGTPTLADFRLLEQQTGLNAGVAPISEYSNAIYSLNNILRGNSVSNIRPYIYPNGREVDLTPKKIKRELNLIQKAKYNNVFYDPATYAEFNWKNSIGLK